MKRPFGEFLGNDVLLAELHLAFAVLLVRLRMLDEERDRLRIPLEAVMADEGWNGDFLVELRLLAFLRGLHRKHHADLLVAHGLGVVQPPRMPRRANLQVAHLVVRQARGIAEVEDHAGVVVRLVTRTRNRDQSFLLGQILDDGAPHVLGRLPEQETERRQRQFHELVMSSHVVAESPKLKGTIEHLPEKRVVLGMPLVAYRDDLAGNVVQTRHLLLRFSSVALLSASPRPFPRTESR